MRPGYHVVAGAALGAAAFAFSGDGAVALAAAASHVLLDVDHAVEHLLQSHRPFSVPALLRVHNALTWERLVFLLHGYEWAGLLWLVWWLSPHPLLLAVAIGVSTHLVLDEVGNRLEWAPVDIAPAFYFFTYRLGRGFLRERLTRLRPGRVIESAGGRSA
ncbi:MAG TPA: hypothetical protein VN317_02880 [Candidatus Methanoperedens sp.]|nr:hypothetical protein [Candidatus Methanoperedens sp.]